MATNDTQTDYRIGRDNIQLLGLDIHNPVFAVSSLTIIAFVGGVLAFREAAGAVFNALHAWLTSTFDWVFLGAGNLFILFCLLLVVSPLGRIRLGGPDAKPDYSVWSWFAMLFAAGIGIGLMFFGVAEPITHFRNPPLGVDAGDTAAAQRMAIAAAIFHWGLHPWAMYAVVALALAFAAYNLGLPLTLRSAFYPVLGKAVWGRFGHLIDVLTVFAALFGLATSLGLGAEQTAAGLALIFGVPANTTTKVLIIATITFVAIASVVAGMDRGVKRLSQANLLLALLLLAFVLAVGPTPDLLTGFVASIGHYLAAIGPLSNWVGRCDFDFMHGWTTFFWAWWLSWSPFVGMFIARVSRGRTVRELVGCMLVVPTLVSALWMNAFGQIRAVELSRGWPFRGGRGRAGPATGAGPVQDAGDVAARRGYLDCRHRPGHHLLRHLLRFRLARRRHHHRRRQAGCAGGSARLLVRIRRHCRHHAAGQRRTGGAADGFALDRFAVRVASLGNVLQHLEGSAGRPVRIAGKCYDDVTGGSPPGARASRPHHTGKASPISSTRLDRQRRQDSASAGPVAFPLAGRVPNRRETERPATAVHAGGTPALPGGVRALLRTSPWRSRWQAGCRIAGRLSGSQRQCMRAGRPRSRVGWAHAVPAGRVAGCP